MTFARTTHTVHIFKIWHSRKTRSQKHSIFLSPCVSVLLSPELAVEPRRMLAMWLFPFTSVSKCIRRDTDVPEEKIQFALLGP